MIGSALGSAERFGAAAPYGSAERFGAVRPNFKVRSPTTLQESGPSKSSGHVMLAQ